MSSTTFLYHALGITGYHYASTLIEKGRFVFRMVATDQQLGCSACNSRNVIKRGRIGRYFRTLPIGHKPIILALDVPRVGCLTCGVVRQIKLKFADERVSYTHAFERFVVSLSRLMTMQDVAKHLKIGWDMVKEIQKRYLKRHFSNPALKDLRLLAIDEISIAKGQCYLTVVLDLESGAIVFVGDGKGADALTPFFEQLRKSKAKIEAVAIDMSAAYIHALREHLPAATIVFDHFHVVKLFNEKLSEFRRDLQAEASKIEKGVLKGTRWLLLKNPENLNDRYNERERLETALKLNQPLATVYYMKEDLRRFWDQSDKAQAEICILDWIRRALVSGITMLAKFARLLGAYRTGILSYYDFPISTGPLEGINNKIKTMKRQAYGFRDLDFFKLKIMSLHQAKYALVG